MKSKLYRTCEVIKYDKIYASCELRYLKNRYVINVLYSGDDLFVDFEIENDTGQTPEIAIANFEKECLNRFTCYGDFSLEEIKEDSGEEISFS